MLFQEPRLLPWLSIEDNLCLVRPDPLPSATIDALLDDLMLPRGVRELRPATVSLGMARRLALARSLAIDPAPLVLDEPFASLDALAVA
ncbi:MAG: ATP-binding cassette domain-containing protein [Rhodopila sp.]